MINKTIKEIEKQANKFATHRELKEVDLRVKRAFIAGAKWALNY